MLIGVPKEIKIHEYRVGLVPGSGARAGPARASVMVERGAGAGIGFADDAYRAAGAASPTSAGRGLRAAEMIVKVKEPQPAECALLRPGQLLFTYLHLAADRAQTQALLELRRHLRRL